ncbi:hypothetical protein P6144_01150 [Sphingomonas sp. HITSZ_GF]|uniref:hypothetical protein n=1 Tax=Sphingomonas sp. HITSZ_GF TaxID=3037247 RepID=UPI00240D38D8|nr:hypothetical protein [Sphingomonas sp. HITSZ_GF]MDG2532241.1 hypothetical protein [Sphingomonas sp. HITSZ_GF]
MRVVVVGGLLILAGCGGSGTTGTNYSDPPPMAEIVATPSPKATETPEPTPTPDHVETTVIEPNSAASVPDNAN